MVAKKSIYPMVLALAIAGFVPAASAQHDGVQVGEASRMRTLISAEKLERSAAQDYEQLKREAAQKDALAPPNNPQLQRLRGIAQRILPFAPRFNPRATNWRWEVNLIASAQLNAFCMPGGKIAFYTGIINKLQLTDDEIAIVMGHEIAHALREHAREQAAKRTATSVISFGANLAASILGGGKYADVTRIGTDVLGNLAVLSFSREDEQDADLVGLDLAARAGFDPRAGISLWKKMGAASKGAPPQWLSTHPSGENRIRDIERHLPEVMPLYEAARGGLAK